MTKGPSPTITIMPNDDISFTEATERILLHTILKGTEGPLHLFVEEAKLHDKLQPSHSSCGQRFKITPQHHRHTMSSSSTSASLKTRHYAQLASRLNHLQANLESTEVEMELMSKQLVSMAKLGAWCGSQ